MSILIAHWIHIWWSSAICNPYQMWYGKTLIWCNKFFNFLQATTTIHIHLHCEQIARTKWMWECDPECKSKLIQWRSLEATLTKSQWQQSLRQIILQKLLNAECCVCVAILQWLPKAQSTQCQSHIVINSESTGVTVTSMQWKIDGVLRTKRISYHICLTSVSMRSTENRGMNPLNECLNF